MVTAIVYNNITATLTETTHPNGNFICGDPAVEGPCTLEDLSPAPTGTGVSARNGAMLNPQVRRGYGRWNSLGMDGRQKVILGYYNDVLNVGYEIVTGTGVPLALVVNDRMLLSKSNSGTGPHVTPYGDSYTAEHPFMDSMVQLTVVGDNDGFWPAIGSIGTYFRPPPTGPISKLWTTSDVDYTKLKGYAKDLGGPAIDTVLTWRKHPAIEWIQTWDWRNIFAQNNSPGYGSNVSNCMSEIMCMLLEDHDSGKLQTLSNHIIQWGLDIYAAYLAGNSWPHDGGHYQGRLAAVLFAGWMLDDQPMLSVDITRFAEGKRIRRDDNRPSFHGMPMWWQMNNEDWSNWSRLPSTWPKGLWGYFWGETNGSNIGTFLGLRALLGAELFETIDPSGTMLELMDYYMTAVPTNVAAAYDAYTAGGTIDYQKQGGATKGWTDNVWDRWRGRNDHSWILNNYGLRSGASASLFAYPDRRAATEYDFSMMGYYISEGATALEMWRGTPITPVVNISASTLIAVDATAKTFTLSSGTWTVTPAVDDVIRVGGGNNQLEYSVASATTTVITVNESPIVTESAGESITITKVGVRTNTAFIYMTEGGAVKTAVTTLQASDGTGMHHVRFNFDRNDLDGDTKVMFQIVATVGANYVATNGLEIEAATAGGTGGLTPLPPPPPTTPPLPPPTAPPGTPLPVMPGQRPINKSLAASATQELIAADLNGRTIQVHWIILTSTVEADFSIISGAANELIAGHIAAGSFWFCLPIQSYPGEAITLKNDGAAVCVFKGGIRYQFINQFSGSLQRPPDRLT